MWLQKRFGLSPKEDKSGLGWGKKDGCSLSLTVDGSGVAELNNTVHLCSNQGCTVDFTPKTSPSSFDFCLCTYKSCCVQGQAEQYCTLVQQTHLNWNVALHKNGIEIYQKVNGGISFHLTIQENGVRRRTMSYDVTHICLQYLPLSSNDVIQIFCNIYPCMSNKLSRVVLYNW